MGKETEEQKLKYQDYDDRFSTYVWNSETGQFFGRTGIAWAKLTIFYLIFYTGLAAFAGLYFYLFSITLSEKYPKWQLDDSLIGTNPGMGYRPMPDAESNSESTLIWYNRSDPNDVKFWYSQLDDYISKVNLPKNMDNVVTCGDNSYKRATETQSCKVEVNKFGPCNSENNFGFPKGEPCILLKLNRIFGWKPLSYGITEDGKFDRNLLYSDLSKDEIPKSLKNQIFKEIASKTANETAVILSTIWVTCEGESVADKENVGDIQFYPQAGIPGYYFPFYKQEGYQSPFIFLQLTRPVTGMLLNIECKAWAKNIKHDRVNRLGSVHFEIMID